MTRKKADSVPKNDKVGNNDERFDALNKIILEKVMHIKSLQVENQKLRDELFFFEGKPLLSPEDALRLAIVEKSPFTMWACNRRFEIVLWEGSSEKTYGYRKNNIIGKNFVKTFVSPPERENARSDTINIIDNAVEFNNFVAEDKSRKDEKLYMLTNCFRVWDKNTEEWLQAEVGLEISDIDSAIKDHRSLREVGIALVAKNQRYLGLEKKELAGQLKVAYSSKLASLDKDEQELNGYVTKLNRKGNQKAAQGVQERNLRDFQKTRVSLIKSMEELLSNIELATSIEECQTYIPLVEKFGRDDNKK